MLKSALDVSVRKEVGSKACHRIRNHGHIPGVVYGTDVHNKNVELDKKEMDTILRTYGANKLLELVIDKNHTTVMIKDIQRHPVTNEIMHVDFQEISYNVEIHATVPILLRGKDKVESKEGIVQQQLRELHISCLPQHIPKRIELDVSILTPGHPLRVVDVEFAGELSILNDPGEIIASLARTEKVVDDPGEGESEGLLDRLIKI